MKIEKIFRAIKDGSFFYKAKIFLHCRIPFFYVKSHVTANRCMQDACYESLLRKYKKVLDSEIAENFNEKNANPKRVWICWFQGIESAPPLVKACINSVKKNLLSFEVVVLSDKNISEYVELPEFITKKREKGIIPPAQYSDILRTELLCKYDGLWCDATVFCTKKDGLVPSVLQNEFFVFKALDLSRDEKTPTLASNWFIYSAHPNNKILMKTRELLFAYWKRENVLKEYFLFHMFFAMASRKFKNEWKKVPVFNNHSPHVLQFEFEEKFSQKRWEEICYMSDFHKLNHHKDYSAFENSFYAKVIEEACI